MPTYDYKCPNCRITVEVHHKMNESLVLTCTNCAEIPALQRCISIGLGVHFKGSGFYETDYKGK